MKKYEIVHVIGGWMLDDGRTRSQVYTNWYEVDALAKWLTQRDAGYPI